MKIQHAIDKAAHIIGGLKELGALLGVTKGAVHQWKHPKRTVPEKHCVAIERATAGAVTRKDLRPNDWHLIWPELAASSCTASSDSDSLPSPHGGDEEPAPARRVVVDNNAAPQPQPHQDSKRYVEPSAMREAA